jgi:hypothetical protein
MTKKRIQELKAFEASRDEQSTGVSEKRFTRKLGGEVFVLRKSELNSYSLPKRCSEKELNAALEALCQYENTGLTPTEVEELVAENKQLTSELTAIRALISSLEVMKNAVAE